MTFRNQEYEFNPKLSESERPTFADKLQDLLLGVEFEEPRELLEARAATLEALTRESRNPALIQSVWIEYGKICEQIVDDKAESDPRVRTRLQITVLIHKALIFRDAGNIQRYGEDLTAAQEYAHNIRLDEIAEAIGGELDELAR